MLSTLNKQNGGYTVAVLRSILIIIIAEERIREIILGSSCGWLEIAWWSELSLLGQEEEVAIDTSSYPLNIHGNCYN